MRAKIIAGNWKMNGSNAANTKLLDELLLARPSGNVKLVVCAPFPYLSAVRMAIEGSAIALGAQNLAEYEVGAYTGEVSASMLADVGCQYVIIGHSERRSLFGESDAVVGLKCKRALDGGLIPIVCVGETLAEREQGLTHEVVVRQLAAVIDALPAELLARIVVAYEPVWAIGTGRTASPAQAQEVHAWIRERLAQSDAAVAQTVPVLYGGSMKPSNAAELLSQADIDGGLIGGASLVAGDFLSIAKAVN